MIIDVLNAEQRIRLEAVAQANLRLGQALIENPERAVSVLLREATRIADYISGTDQPKGDTTT